MAKQSKPAAQKEGAIQTVLVEDLGPIVFFFLPFLQGAIKKQKY